MVYPAGGDELLEIRRPETMPLTVEPCSTVEWLTS
jgi:hypothetical protein